MDWFPWYFLLYKSDTMHLNPYQDGCYRRLIDHYMETRQALPDNDAALARIIGDSEANWLAMASPLVRLFFQSKNGRLFHRKCEQTLNDQDNRAKSLSESGKNGAAKRWNKIKGTDSHPIADPMGCDSTGQDSTIQEKDTPLPPKGEIDLTKDQNFILLWSIWKPFDMPKGNPQPAAKSFSKAIKKTPPEKIIASAKSYCADCTKRKSKTQHVVTWLNQKGWEAEIPEHKEAKHGYVGM